MRAAANSSIIICERDYQSLLPLAEKHKTPLAQALEDELSRAEVVANKDLPTDAVAMNSMVTFVDLRSSEETRVKLVYPQEASVDLMKISILSPVGSALIGLRVGGEINWPLPGGSSRLLKVVAVQQSLKSSIQ